MCGAHLAPLFVHLWVLEEAQVLGGHLQQLIGHNVLHAIVKALLLGRRDGDGLVLVGPHVGGSLLLAHVDSKIPRPLVDPHYLQARTEGSIGELIVANP